MGDALCDPCAPIGMRGCVEIPTKQAVTIVASGERGAGIVFGGLVQRNHQRDVIELAEIEGLLVSNKHIEVAHRLALSEPNRGPIQAQVCGNTPGPFEVGIAGVGQVLVGRHTGNTVIPPDRYRPEVVAMVFPHRCEQGGIHSATEQQPIRPDTIGGNEKSFFQGINSGK